MLYELQAGRVLGIESSASPFAFRLSSEVQIGAYPTNRFCSDPLTLVTRLHGGQRHMAASPIPVTQSTLRCFLFIDIPFTRLGLFIEHGLEFNFVLFTHSADELLHHQSR